MQFFIISFNILLLLLLLLIIIITALYALHNLIEVTADLSASECNLMDCLSALNNIIINILFTIAVIIVSIIIINMITIISFF